MKHLILAALFLGYSHFAFAADFELSKVCDKDPKDRFAFIEKTRDKIIDKTKDMKPDSKKAKKFDGSDMHQWLKLTYPGFMPRHLYDAGDKECADMHLDFAEATDPTVSEKALEDWKACLQAAYRNDLRPMMTRLIQCYEPESTPSK